jgi:hypothetical protein
VSSRQSLAVGGCSFDCVSIGVPGPSSVASTSREGHWGMVRAHASLMQQRWRMAQHSMQHEACMICLSPSPSEPRRRRRCTAYLGAVRPVNLSWRRRRVLMAMSGRGLAIDRGPRLADLDRGLAAGTRPRIGQTTPSQRIASGAWRNDNTTPPQTLRALAISQSR